MRWQFPFKTREAAERELSNCRKQTGKRAFVKKITLQAEIYKVFPSQKDYQRYLDRRGKSKGIYVLKGKS